jgi:hypothetical protein
VASPGREGPKVWILDTTGKVADLIKAKKLQIQDDEGGGGGGPGGPGHHFHRPMPN